jgi:hypothetical protein
MRVQLALAAVVSISIFFYFLLGQVIGRRRFALQNLQMELLSPWTYQFFMVSDGVPRNKIRWLSFAF